MTALSTTEPGPKRRTAPSPVQRGDATEKRLAAARREACLKARCPISKSDSRLESGKVRPFYASSHHAGRPALQFKPLPQLLFAEVVTDIEGSLGHRIRSKLLSQIRNIVIVKLGPDKYVIGHIELKADSGVDLKMVRAAN